MHALALYDTRILDVLAQCSNDSKVFGIQRDDAAMADVQKCVIIISATYVSFDTFETSFCPTDEAFEK